MNVLPRRCGEGGILDISVKSVSVSVKSASVFVTVSVFVSASVKFVSVSVKSASVFASVYRCWGSDRFG